MICRLCLYSGVSSNDEVGELKQQINDLYSTLLITIDNLEFKNKEILKLEKLKYDFFKGASHELKTPLASLKIILENMKYNIGKYKDRDTYINECIEIVDSLTKNISQILSVHSIENLNNDEEYLKINDTLEDILEKYEILANQKKITVNNYISDENIYIGKTALKIILSNLISNAIKYTDVSELIKSVSVARRFIRSSRGLGAQDVRWTSALRGPEWNGDLPNKQKWKALWRNNGRNKRIDYYRCYSE